MRLSVMLAFSAVSLLLVGCDRAVPPAEQAPEDAGQEEFKKSPEPSSAAVPADNDVPAGKMTLNGEDGTTAELTRDFAGQPAPDVQFRGADGRYLKLSDFSGRPLLVNVWATWCAPCKREMPALDSLAEIEAGTMSVIAISQDLKGRVPVRAFFESVGIQNLESYTDKPNAISKALAPGLPLPATVLYDTAGREVWRVIGEADWDSENMAALLDEAS